MLHLKRKCNSCNGYNGEKHPKSESRQESYCFLLTLQVHKDVAGRCCSVLASLRGRQEWQSRVKV